MTQELKKMIFNEKSVDTLVALKKKDRTYPRKLSEYTDTTYSHTVRLLQSFQEKGLVESKKHGRRKDYRLTRKGDRVAEQLVQLYEATGIGTMSSPEPGRTEEPDRPKLSESLKAANIGGR